MSENSVEVWRGSVATWECDSMGHMNIRFYVSRAVEGLAGLAAALGMPEAFSAHAASTMIVREHHIRFLREARADAPLHMDASVVEMGETDATLLQVLRHSISGEPAATFFTRVVHARPQGGRIFPWPTRARAAAQGLTTPIPDFAQPRGIDNGPVQSKASLALADTLGLRRGAGGAVQPQECDVFGRLRPDAAMARMSEGIHLVLHDLYAAVGEVDPALAQRLGGAALEYRLIYGDLPTAGAGLDIRSSGIGVTPKLRRLRHWLLDPVTGRAWASCEVVAANFDLEARKVVAIPGAAVEAISKLQRSDMPL